MKFKRIVSMLTVASISLTSFMTAWAEYPEHKKLNDQIVIRGLEVGPSPTENIFSVDGKKFILLDVTENGNYFVITEDNYGTRAFVDNASEIDIGGWDCADSEWDYDPERENSVAYWLNNEFLTNGNGDGNVLPEEIVKNLVESEWVVENNFTYGNGKVTVAAVGQATYDKYQAWRAKKAVLKTTVSKLALMSHTEYNAYKNKISGYVREGEDMWAGFMLRTPASTVTVTGSDVKIENSFYQVRTITNNTIVAATQNGTFTKSNFLIRPVFILNKDFFKKVRVDVETAGENVIDVINNNDFTDMAELYTDDELSYFGYDVNSYPVIKNLIITGFKKVGALNEIFYDFSSSNGQKESGTLIEKYAGDSEQGPFAVFENAYPVSYTDGEKAGQWVKLALIPSSGDRLGKRYYSDMFRLDDASSVMVTKCRFLNSQNEEITTLTENSDVSAEITLSGNAEIQVITIAHYDKDNTLKAMKSVDSNTNDTVYTISLDNMEVQQGDYIKLMAESKLDGAPHYVKVLK